MNIDLKPIAESKVRQLGGDVCGVLVRTHDSEVMAVSEHGRCTRLDAGVMGPVEPAGMSDMREEFEKWWSPQGHDAPETSAKAAAWRAWQAARAQGGQGAEVVASVNKARAGEYEFYPASGLLDMPIGIHTLYAHQPAQPAVPHWKELESLADEYVEGYEFRGDEGDYQPTERERFLIEDCVAGLMDEIHQMLKRATPQPEGDGWIKCSERLPTEADADDFGNLWACYAGDDEAENEPVRHARHYEYWKPTGLKSPQPPAGQEGAQ